jgi:GTP-binding protein HflX
LERLGGGIGTRGPGETQIETDRRLVRNRIQHLKRSLQDVRRHRQLHRARRNNNSVPVVSLVGYTNAGKSTLLNKLTKADVRAEDRLFSTLDPVTRRITLPSGGSALVTDTVGFIHKLPPALVAAFRATLEEIEESTVIMHVLDATHVNSVEQALVVESILKDMHVDRLPRILVMNKVDLLPENAGLDEIAAPFDLGPDDRSAFISAMTGLGTSKLLTELDEALAVGPAISAATG